MIPEEDVLKDHISMRQILSMYPEIDKWRLHYILRTRKDNGLDKILVKIGLKFYVNVYDFEKWRKEHDI